MASEVDQENESGKRNPYMSEYKKRTWKMDQESRRHILLEEQKRRREESYDVFRDFSDIFTFVDDSSLDDIEEDKEVLSGGNKNEIIEKPRFPKLKNLFMFSEWMTELPHDFEDKWLLMPCPVGKRCLVKSCKGSTSVYNKTGYQSARFRSALPNGGFHNHGPSKYSKADITILDCIWNGTVQKYFILDILYWKSQSYLDTDVIEEVEEEAKSEMEKIVEGQQRGRVEEGEERIRSGGHFPVSSSSWTLALALPHMKQCSRIGFRHFWIKSKIEEMPWISEKSKNNPYPFVPLNSYSCDYISISSVMSKYPYFEYDKPPIDGLLFYHKDGYYTPGVNPLVLWLKPFMLGEILGQDVHLAEEYARAMATDYTNMFDYISKFEEMRKQRLKGRRKKDKRGEDVERMELCIPEADDLDAE